MHEVFPKELRLSSSTWIAISGWILLALLYAEPVFTAQWQIVIDYGPWIAGIAWLLFVFFWAPRLIVDLENVRVRNIWLTTIVPYSRMDDASVGTVVKIKYRDNGDIERTILVWNAPGLPKITKAFAGENPEPIEVFGESKIVTEMWQEHLSDPDAPVERKVHWITIAITAVFAVLLAVKLWL